MFLEPGRKGAASSWCLQVSRKLQAQHFMISTVPQTQRLSLIKEINTWILLKKNYITFSKLSQCTCFEKSKCFERYGVSEAAPKNWSTWSSRCPATLQNWKPSSPYVQFYNSRGMHLAISTHETGDQKPPLRHLSSHTIQPQPRPTLVH